MAEGKSKTAWDHTSTVVCAIYNSHMDGKKSKPFKPRQFHPHYAAKSEDAIVIDKSNRHLLREAFGVKGKHGKC